MWVCTRSTMYVSECVLMCVHLEARSQCQVSLLKLLALLFETGHLIEPGARCSLPDWLASEPQKSTSLHTGISGMHCGAWMFFCTLRIRTCLLTPVSLCLTNGAVLPEPIISNNCRKLYRTEKFAWMSPQPMTFFFGRKVVVGKSLVEEMKCVHQCTSPSSTAEPWPLIFANFNPVSLKFLLVFALFRLVYYLFCNLTPNQEASVLGSFHLRLPLLPVAYLPPLHKALFLDRQPLSYSQATSEKRSQVIQVPACCQQGLQSAIIRKCTTQLFHDFK